MPRTGGEADKAGNRFELRWTVQELLRVIQGEARSITVEPLGEIGDGIEFILDADSGAEAHQVKRQNAMSDRWTLPDLNRRGALRAAAKHTGEGRVFRFISTIPASLAAELCERAVPTVSVEEFTEHGLTNDDLRAGFPTLSSADYLGSPDSAWRMLRRSKFEWHNEDDIVNFNAAIAGQLYQGLTGRAAASALGDLILDNLGIELTREVIESQLAKHGLVATSPEQARATSETVEGLTAKWLSELHAQILRPAIPRPEADELARQVAAAEERLFFLVAGAGSGKSVVLHDFARSEMDRGTPVLAFRLDRLEGFRTTQDIGEGLGMSMSPVSALKLAMGERERGILIVDQIDAISQLSGRAPAGFSALADLVQEAMAFPGIRVVVACRKFDLQNDHRIGSLAARPETASITVQELTDPQMDDAVLGMGLDPAQLTPQQRAILRTPLHLVLLRTIADEPDPLGFQTSTHLFEAFWDRKRLAVNARREGVEFAKVLGVLANKMSSRQQLSVPRSVLDVDSLTEDADVLESENVLVRDGSNLSFFHETFFDYVFSRAWIAEEGNLVDFLLGGEQELFRRAQVRQILTHLHDAEPSRFLRELGGVLSDGRIRFHIKAAAISIVRALPNPTPAEARLLVRLADRQPKLKRRIETLFRSPVWLERLDSDGYIEEWLNGPKASQDRALNVMAGAGDRHGDRLAELLTAHRTNPDYPGWARWVLRFTEVNTSRALFDVLIDAVASGFYDGDSGTLWMSVFHLGDLHPDWGVDLLRAYFIDQPGSLDLDEQGKIARLMPQDRQAVNLIEKSASADPKGFVEAFLPYVLAVMAATASPSSAPRPHWDGHFSFRHRTGRPHLTVDETLFAALDGALGRALADDPESMRPALEQLAADPRDAAQFLLYDAVIANPKPFAEWAATTVLQDPSRWLCGYIDDSVWKARELLEAIVPFVSDETFNALEDAVRDLKFEWEGEWHGNCAFKLLTVLESERLSELGRTRLAELRERFGRDQPEPPMGIQSGSIGSPISVEAAQELTDEGWLEAMAKYAGDETDWTTFTGGARELAQVVHEQAKREPQRFAKLALDLTSDFSTAYGDAVLLGLGDADTVDDPEMIFAAVRHIASFHHDANDRWIGSAIHRYHAVVPDDIVELVLERALTDADPADDGIRIWNNDRETGEKIPQIYASGINTTRGSLAQSLADLLITDDASGRRAAIISPRLADLARDPSIPVRACVARVIGASLLRARPAAIEAFRVLIDAGDALLSAHTISDLVLYIGTGGGKVHAVIERMLRSEMDAVREVGGQLAAFAAIEWEVDDQLDDVIASEDSWARRGAAMVAAVRAPKAARASKAAEALGAFLEDESVEVRRQAATFVAELRDSRLRPFRTVLHQIIASGTFREALPQLLLTLEHAPDDVDDIILLCAQRFLEVLGADAADIRTSAAGDASHVAQLIVSAYFRTDDASERRGLLDVLDGLLEIDAFGIDEVVDESER